MDSAMPDGRQLSGAAAIWSSLRRLEMPRSRVR